MRMISIIIITFRYRTQPGIYENRPTPPPPCADLDLVDWTWLTGPGWRDLVDRTWLTSPGWPSRYVSELSFVWLILFAIVLLQIVPFRSYMFLQFVIKIVSFQWFCFPCQNCIFSVSLFRIDIVQFLPFQNCQCPDASLSDVFFLSCSFPQLSLSHFS